MMDDKKRSQLEEDHYQSTLGHYGVRTGGSWSNEIAYQDWDRRQNAEKASSPAYQEPPRTHASSPGRSQPGFTFSSRTHNFAAVIGAVVSGGFALQQGFTLGGVALCTAVGSICGLFALYLLYWALRLVLIVLTLAIVAAIGYGLLRLLAAVL